LVKKAGIPAASIAVISPYKANVELFERCRKDSQHSAPLLDMPPAATVDSFQGREADIMVVILGTTKEVGPGFTIDKNRLNVMFSRQKSGLLVFGDIDVLGLWMGAAVAETCKYWNWTIVRGYRYEHKLGLNFLSVKLKTSVWRR
jgi:superfamily I DNA and/or RNA helicase